MRFAPERYRVYRNRERGEVLLGLLDELRVGYTTCADKNHTVSGIVGFDIGGKVIPLDGQDVGLGSEDGAA